MYFKIIQSTVMLMMHFVYVNKYVYVCMSGCMYLYIYDYRHGHRPPKCSTKLRILYLIYQTDNVETNFIIEPTIGNTPIENEMG